MLNEVCLSVLRDGLTYIRMPSLVGLISIGMPIECRICLADDDWAYIHWNAWLSIGFTMQIMIGLTFIGMPCL